MIVALLLLIDVALMCYLAWKVGSAARPQAPQDLGWLHFRERRDGDGDGDGGGESNPANPMNRTTDHA